MLFVVMVTGVGDIATPLTVKGEALAVMGGENVATSRHVTPSAARRLIRKMRFQPPTV